MADRIGCHFLSGESLPPPFLAVGYRGNVRHTPKAAVADKQKSVAPSSFAQKTSCGKLSAKWTLRGSVVTGALLRSGSADPLGDILVYLERARGYVSGSPIDYCLPCTASEDAVCQILASAPLWHEFLCWLDLECASCLEWERNSNSCTSAMFVIRGPHLTCCFIPPPSWHWLLKTHRCVVSVHIPYIRDIIMKCILDHIELDDLLWKNDS
ncbi:hypothetical protein HPB51_026581 [Rhipicephalus microplus]|uniref:Uncharacterized protein n=1 Tax=Rhipicephalus microplus TaxID=6941 RepID=A0A9J6D2I6_RHIMP|nr:hypothetical protein HPB51_026581 [Rhipicephalus microplus]